MTLANIIDRRRRPYRWARINAIIEATWHDNGGDDADQADEVRDAREVTYGEWSGISVSEAITWASAASCPVTLFLYDDGDGTTLA